MKKQEQKTKTQSPTTGAVKKALIHLASKKPQKGIPIDLTAYPPQVQAVFNFFKAKDYGYLATHEEMKKVLRHWKLTQHEYYAYIRTAAGLLMRNGHAIGVSKGYGYKVLKPYEWTKEMGRHVFKSLKSFATAVDYMSFAPMQDMPDRLREFYVDMNKDFLATWDSLAKLRNNVFGDVPHTFYTLCKRAHQNEVAAEAERLAEKKAKKTR